MADVNKSQLNKSAVNSALISTLFVTLLFLPSVQDPFNSPKLWLLILSSAWCLGFLFLQLNQFKTISKPILSLFTIFAVSIFISGVLTQQIYTAFFGTYQRRDGVFSYFALIILLLVLLINIRFEYSKSVKQIFVICASVIGIYGFLQSVGSDFVRWNNPYNAIIGTLGNPNFASAMMAIFATFLVVQFIKANHVYKFLYLALILLLLYNIVHSQSRQGLVAFGAGTGFALSLLAYKKSKSFGSLVFVSYLIVGLLAIAGMLQRGPFEPILYKESVSIRGFYWRAAIEMFKAKPIFGVGFDSYGDYFKIYREINYPLRYGFSITSTNAHSVPLQMFGTGGLFVGLSYLAIVFITIYYSIKKIKELNGEKLYFFVATFGAWIAYQAQSIISIDSLGLAVWGWTLTGILLGLSLKTDATESQVSLRKVTNSTVFVKQRLLSALFFVIALIPVSILYRNELSVYLLRADVDRAVSTNQVPADFFNRAKAAINAPLQDPYHKSMVASYMVTAGFQKEGISEIKSITESQPRNEDALLNLAFYQEKLSLFNDSIVTRQKIAVLDPYNGANYLQLGRTFKYLGNYPEMEKMREKVLSFAANTPEGKAAASELVR